LIDICSLYVDNIHYLLNKPKKSTFTYNSDRIEYLVTISVIVELCRYYIRGIAI